MEKPDKYSEDLASQLDLALRKYKEAPSNAWVPAAHKNQWSTDWQKPVQSSPVIKSPNVNAASTASAGAAQPTPSEFAYPQFRSNKGRLIYGARMEDRQTADKDYTVTVTERVHIDGKVDYVVEVAHGPIGKPNPQKTIKTWNGKDQATTRDRALTTAKQLVGTKTGGKGYQLVAEHKDDTELDPALSNDPYTKFIPYTDPLDDEVPAKEEEPPVPQLPCECAEHIEGIAVAAWSDPQPATAEVAPYLTQPGFGLVRFADKEQQPRWAVGIDGSCGSGYLHAKAIPVGDGLGGKRRDVGKIESATIESLSKSTRSQGRLDIILVVEQVRKSPDKIVVIDLLRWEGQDMTDKDWVERRTVLESNFHAIFPEQTGTRQVELGPRVMTRLRETYLTESESYRFELYGVEGLPGDQVWSLPS